MIHDLKCWPEYFQAVKFGIKPFELRKDDRGFAVGDILHLREYDPDTELYTGDEIDKTVTYVLPTKLFGAIGEGAKYVIMGLAPRDWTPCADGLPEIMKRVIVTICGEIVIAEREHELDDDETTPIHWYDDEGCRFNDDVVTAWIPLPEPWTGGLDGK